MQKRTLGIQSLQVIGLHEQFDINLNLKEDLNVLYGKNGKGKTTILHIIANFLELDIYRFKYLKFKSIKITSFSNIAIDIIKNDSKDSIKITSYYRDDLFSNEILSTYEIGPETEIGQEFKKLIRDNFGGPSLYLPAFRAILERVKDEYNYYTNGTSADEKIQKLRSHERQLEIDAGINGERRYIGTRQDPSYLTARKTLQCREWFGEFVPKIRYPSISDVRLGIINEYREAMLDLATEERHMFSEMFILVLKELLSDEKAPNQSEVDEIIENIKITLNESEDNQENIYIDGPYYSIVDRLKQTLQELSEKSWSTKDNSAERKVLKLYLEMLNKRNENKKASLEKIRKFENSVNKFLDQKKLCVNEISDNNKRIRTVYIEGKNNYKYDLSSLSSGERQVLTMLYSASRIKVANGLFLIDEPELSLHVDWQRRIIKELRNMAGNRQIIACTHAPEVGADHLEDLEEFNVLEHSPSSDNYPNLDNLFGDDIA